MNRFAIYNMIEMPLISTQVYAELLKDNDIITMEQQEYAAVIERQSIFMCQMIIPLLRVHSLA